MSLDVLIPHYQDPAGLLASLISVYSQSWTGETRIVIADDGSENPNQVDGVLEAMHQLYPCKSHVSFDVVYNQRNMGRPFTRNVLLRSVKNEFVAWLDAGDEWYPEKLELQFNKLNSLGTPEMVWITCNYDWVWDGGAKKIRRQVADGDQVKALLRGQKLRAYLWTILGSAESFKNLGYFDERLLRLQDLDYFIRFSLHSGRIQNVDDERPLCVYHKSDVGRDSLTIRDCNGIIFDKHRVLYNRYGSNFKNMRLFDMEMLAARFAKNNNDMTKYCQFLVMACRRHPIAFLKHIKNNGV